MPLHTYSQGMAMRLAFAATTAFANDILAMDEWIGAGDAAFQEKIIARMNDFLHASTIVVVASHSVNLLRRLANKAIWLEQGRVRSIGGPDIIDEYETSVSTWGLDPVLLGVVRGGRGLWLHGAANDDGVRLLWNVSTNAGDLQLVLRRPDGSRQVVRPLIQRCGAWPMAPWVRPGMQFEIVSPRADDAFASLSVPANA
jgi:energy-coupling factor transporter ATP-binding protein EcfA2